MNLYAIFFVDGRERKHVAAVAAPTPQEALNRLIKNEGILYPPHLEDVEPINPAEYEDGVQVLWHQNYD